MIGATTAAHSDPQWAPSPSRRAAARMSRFLEEVHAAGLTDARDYHELWRWSVTDLDGFWRSVWAHFDVADSGNHDVALAEERMPGARWFPDARVNFAHEALRDDRSGDDRVALVHADESDHVTTLARQELRRQVAAAAAGLREVGVGAGDRVVAYVPNIPEAVIGMLAATSLGAVWSACPPEFGPRSVIDRFGQIEPKVLLTIDRYRYRGQVHERRDAVQRIRAGLPTLRHTVRLPYAGAEPAPYGGDGQERGWAELTSEPAHLEATWVAFDHPLWVVYSSGTTGPPKPIVHGHGGIVLEHLKWLGLHTDLGPQDRFFWFTSTGWIIWNVLVGALLTGSACVLYDGDPSYPDTTRLWKLARATGATFFGGSPPYFDACRRAGTVPGEVADLSAVRAIGSSGSPLTPEGSRWLQDAVGDHVHIGSASGGTDIASAFVGPCPLLPVYPGEIQCRLLGAAVEAYDPDGNAVIDQVGELVATRPLPSMPVRFWEDADDRRYRASYFETYPGVWRHGDWLRITPRGTCIISGRSDATLKRGGVRMGTSEFYRVIEGVPGVADSLVVDVPTESPRSHLVLLLALEDDTNAGQVRAAVEQRLRAELSPRHVPDFVFTVSEIPRTLNGKKLELPTKRILAGAPRDQVLTAAAVANPGSLDELDHIAAAYRAQLAAAPTGGIPT